MDHALKKSHGGIWIDRDAWEVARVSFQLMERVRWWWGIGRISDATEHIDRAVVREVATRFDLVARTRAAGAPVSPDGGPAPPMTADRIDLPQGTLELLILRTLTLEPQHGWAISERIRQVSSDVLHVRQGSLYPALHRLDRRGWITASWGTSDHNRRAKFYALTPEGRGQLESDVEAWRALTAAVGRVLDAG